MNFSKSGETGRPKKRKAPNFSRVQTEEFAVEAITGCLQNSTGFAVSYSARQTELAVIRFKRLNRGSDER